MEQQLSAEHTEEEEEEKRSALSLLSLEQTVYRTSDNGPCIKSAKKTIL